MLPWWFSGKVYACQCKRPMFNPWARKIPWNRQRQPTSVFLPRKSHGQRKLEGYIPRGCKSQTQLREERKTTARILWWWGRESGFLSLFQSSWAKCYWSNIIFLSILLPSWNVKVKQHKTLTTQILCQFSLVIYVKNWYHVFVLFISFFHHVSKSNFKNLQHFFLSLYNGTNHIDWKIKSFHVLCYWPSYELC